MISKIYLLFSLFMKKYLLSFLLFVLFPFITYADNTGTWDTLPPQDEFCNEKNFVIEGDNEILTNIPQEFKIVTNTWELSDKQVTFELMKEGKLVEKKIWLSYIRSFTQAWDLILNVHIKTPDCEKSFSRDIRVFKSLYLFIGTPYSFLDNDFVELLKKKWILFRFVKLPKTGPNLWSQDIYQILLKQSDDLETADTLFIENDRSLSILDGLARLEKAPLTKKRAVETQLFIISWTQFSLLSKIIAPYVNKLSVKKIWIIEPENFLNFVVKKWWGEVTQANYISFEKENRYFFSLNTLVQYLAYYWLDYSTISIILSLSFAALILNFCKQFIGINVFGVYYPLLLALGLSIMDINFVITFMVISLLAIGGTTLIGRYISLLYLSKRTLLLSLYIIFCLLFLGIDSYFSLGLVHLDWFANKAILILLLVFVIISDKVFHEDVTLFTKKWFWYTLEFIFIVIISYLSINSSFIQIILLSFPDTIFLLFIGNLLVGRYSWLQLVEYIRFFPILKHLYEEEE